MQAKPWEAACLDICDFFLWTALLVNVPLFLASDKMAYTIRDFILAGVWPNPKGLQARGYMHKISVKSNCYDAYLVIDGGISFAFKDGACAKLEIHAEDALRTVVFSN